MPSERSRSVRKRALVIVNVQNDFFSTGTMPIEGAEAILPEIAELRQKAFDAVFLTRLQRAPNHCAFASNSPGTSLMEVFPVAKVGPQIMKPDHCVCGSVGAELHPDLVHLPSDIVIDYGMDPQLDELSAVGEKGGVQTALFLALKRLAINEIVLAGVSLDQSVHVTALHARLAFRDMAVTVVEEACAVFSSVGVTEAKSKMQTEKVKIVSMKGTEVAQWPEIGESDPFHDFLGTTVARLNQMYTQTAVQRKLSEQSPVRRIPPTPNARSQLGGASFFSKSPVVPSSHSTNRVLDLSTPDRHGDAPATPATPAADITDVRRSSLFGTTTVAQFQSTPSTTSRSSNNAPSAKMTAAEAPVVTTNPVPDSGPAANPQTEEQLPNHVPSPTRRSPPFRIEVATPSPRTASIVAAGDAASDAASGGGGGEGGGGGGGEGRGGVGEVVAGIEAYTMGELKPGAQPNGMFVHGIAEEPVVEASQEEDSMPLQPIIKPEHLMQSVLRCDEARLEYELNHLTNSSLMSIAMKPAYMTVMQAAAYVGNTRIAELVIKAGADIEKCDTELNNPPLLIACRMNNTGAALALIGAGANIVVQDKEFGNTPLMWAVAHNNIALVGALLQRVRHLLLDIAKYLQLRNHYGMTALHFMCAASAAEYASYGEDGFDVDQCMPVSVVMDDSTPAVERVEGQAILLRRKVFAKTEELASLVLHHIKTPKQCLELLSQQDMRRWTAFHYAAKSGMLSKMNLVKLLGLEIANVPLQTTTDSGLTITDLAVWNGRAACVYQLFLDHRTGWGADVDFETHIKGREHSLLDLALMKQHWNTARLLLRAQLECRLYAGPRADEFLHRLILRGDGKGVAHLLNSDLNGVTVSTNHIALTKRIKYPDACTFTFASYNNPIHQHMYRCTTCDKVLCCVCATKCHPCTAWRLSASASARMPTLSDKDKKRDTMQSPASLRSSKTPARRGSTAAGSLEELSLSTPLLSLTLPTAVGVPGSGDRQASTVISWAVVDTSDVNQRYECLQAIAQEDIDKMMGRLLPQMHHLEYLGMREGSCGCDKGKCRALQVVDEREAAGYRFVSGLSDVCAMIPCFTACEQVPNPVDVDNVDLQKELGEHGQDLMAALARNSHEVWAKSRIEDGWQYGETRDNDAKRHPLLLPFDELQPDAKQGNLDGARHQIAVVASLGYQIRSDAGGRSRASTQPKLKTKPHHPRSAPGQAAAGGRDNFWSPNDSPTMRHLRNDSVASTPGRASRPARNSGTGANRGLPAIMSTVSNSSRSLPDGRVVKLGEGRVTRDSAGPAITEASTTTSMEDADFSHDAVLASYQIAEQWQPSPVDTSSIKLPPELTRLVELLAKDSHEKWADEQIEKGVRYAPERHIVSGSEGAQMMSHMLVPFEYLTEAEKNANREAAIELLKVCLHSGFKLSLQPGRSEVDLASLSKKLTDSDQAHIRQKISELQQFKQAIFNSFLFCVARRGEHEMLEPLLAIEEDGLQGAHINSVDTRQRSPLFVAVQRGHVGTAKALLGFGGQLEYRDDHGCTALSIAALYGNVGLTSILLDRNADPMTRDKLGLTPLHYAVYLGRTRVVKLLIRKLMISGVSSVDLDDLDSPPVTGPRSAWGKLITGGTLKRLKAEAGSNTSDRRLRQNLQFSESCDDDMIPDDDGDDNGSSPHSRHGSVVSQASSIGRSQKFRAAVSRKLSRVMSLKPTASNRLVDAQQLRDWRLNDSSGKLRVATNYEPGDESDDGGAAGREGPDRITPLAAQDRRGRAGTAISPPNQRPPPSGRSQRQLTIKATGEPMGRDTKEGPIRFAAGSSRFARSDSSGNEQRQGPPRHGSQRALLANQYDQFDGSQRNIHLSRMGLNPGLNGSQRAIPVQQRGLSLRGLGASVPAFKKLANANGAKSPMPPMGKDSASGETEPADEESGTLYTSGVENPPRMSPLTLAVHARQFWAARLLIKAGSDPSLRDETGISPYERVLLEHSFFDMMKSSLASGGLRDKLHIPGVTHSKPQLFNKAITDVPADGTSTASRARNTDHLEPLLTDRTNMEGVLRARRRSSQMAQKTGGRIGSPALYAQSTEDPAARQAAATVAAQSMGDPLTDGLSPLRKQHSARRGWALLRQHTRSGSLTRHPSMSRGNAGPTAADRLQKMIHQQSHKAPTDAASAERQELLEERQQAKVERERDERIRRTNGELKRAVRMIAVLNTCAAVKKKRNMFAMVTLVKSFITFFVVMLIYGFMTPMAPDFPSAMLSHVQRSINLELTASFDDYVDSREAWWIWFDRHILLLHNSGSGYVQHAEGFAAYRRRGLQEDSRPIAPIRGFQAANNAKMQDWEHAPSAIDSICSDWAAAHQPRTGKQSRRRLQSGSPNTVDEPVATWADDEGSGPEGEDAIFQPGRNGAFEPPLVVLNTNLVVGAIRVRRGTYEPTACSLPKIHNAPDACVDIAGAYADVGVEGSLTRSRDRGLGFGAHSDDGYFWDLNSGNVTARRAVVDPYRPTSRGTLEESAHPSRNDSWTSAYTSYLSIEVSLLNPSVNALVAVRLHTVFAVSGGVYASSVVHAMSPYRGRFQPSTTFELVIGAVLLIQGLFILYEIRTATWQKHVRSGWNVFEMLTWLLFVGIIILDTIALQAANDLTLDLNLPDRYVDMWKLAGLVNIGNYFTAVTVLMLVIRVIKYLRVVPYWGPMVVAVVMTWRHSVVVLYLAVLIVLTASFSIAFHVAFATQNPNFITIPRSFLSLFSMAFAEDWGLMDEGGSGLTVTLFLVFYILFSIVLLNLFIGIVTDVYPDARRRSQEEWERLITELMQEDLSRRPERRRQKHWVLGCLRCLTCGIVKPAKPTKRHTIQANAHPMSQVAAVAPGARAVLRDMEVSRPVAQPQRQSQVETVSRQSRASVTEATGDKKATAWWNPLELTDKLVGVGTGSSSTVDPAVLVFQELDRVVQDLQHDDQGREIVHDEDSASESESDSESDEDSDSGWAAIAATIKQKRRKRTVVEGLAQALNHRNPNMPFAPPGLGAMGGPVAGPSTAEAAAAATAAGGLSVEADARMHTRLTALENSMGEIKAMLGSLVDGRGRTGRDTSLGRVGRVGDRSRTPAPTIRKVKSKAAHR